MRERATFTEVPVAPTLRAMTTKPGDDWNVLPHGPTQKLAENLWWVQGSLRGMSLKRVMTAARRTDGKLVDQGSRSHDGGTREDRAWRRDRGGPPTGGGAALRAGAEVAPAQDTPRSVADIGSRRNFVVIS